MNWIESGVLTWFEQERRQKCKMIVLSAIEKWSYVPSAGLQKSKTSRITFFRKSVKVVNLFLTRPRPLQS